MLKSPMIIYKEIAAAVTRIRDVAATRLRGAGLGGGRELQAAWPLGRRRGAGLHQAPRRVGLRRRRRPRPQHRRCRAAVADAAAAVARRLWY
eukprot:10490280-Alexandrium_andersonii.AAC.1